MDVLARSYEQAASSIEGIAASSDDIVAADGSRYHLHHELKKGVFAAHEYSGGSEPRAVILKRLSLVSINPSYTRERDANALVRRLVASDRIITADRSFEIGGNGYLIFRQAGSLDLSDVIDSWTPDARFLSLRKSRELLRGVAEGLLALHEEGCAHGDLNSGNVVVCDSVMRESPTLETALVDLSYLNHVSLRDVVPRPGFFIGSLGFVSPEIVSGEPPRSIESDRYSYGALAYALVTGLMRGEPGGNAVVTNHIVHGTFEPPHRIRTEIPRHLSHAIMQAMDPEPQKRISPDELLAAFPAK